MVVPLIVTAATTAFMVTATALGYTNLTMLQAIFTAIANNLDVIVMVVTSMLAAITPQLHRADVILRIIELWYNGRKLVGIL